MRISESQHPVSAQINFLAIKILVPILVSGIALFLYLVSIYSDLKLLKKKTQKLIEINQLEINVLDGDVSSLDFGNEFINPSHDYSYDIDLFGKGSLFQYINRTSLATGKEQLASVLTENSLLVSAQAIVSVRPNAFAVATFIPFSKAASKLFPCCLAERKPASR